MNDLLLILISILVAGGLSYFQYYFRAGNPTKIRLFLAFLRFLAIFGILLLLINPRITHTTYEIQKTPLPIMVDNSASIDNLEAAETSRAVFQKLATSQALRQKFDVSAFRFGEAVETSQTFDFSAKQTNFDVVASHLQSVYRNRVFPTILVTDGNQTTGRDYVYSFDPSNEVLPVVVGDTATVTDLRISQINVNKYAFHRNRFPAEVFLQYAGTNAVSADFVIRNGNSVVEKRKVSFDANNRSAVFEVLLPADQVGLQQYRASVTMAQSEKNNYNNSKNFAVEVIDRKSAVAIVSTMNHPDIGALKRSIESNAQRTVAVLRPADVTSVDDYNVVILYQPNSSFKTLVDKLRSAAVNTWTITGTATDFNFMNRSQDAITFRMSSQREDYLAQFDNGFNLFSIDDIGFKSLPPLQHTFGTVNASEKLRVLLNSRIRNVATDAPLLAYADEQGRRSAFLLGEDIWKWRMQSYADNKSFEKFDIFIDKTIQFLSTDNSRKSLVVNHENFYNSGDEIVLSAQYFNKNYELDEKARLTVSITNRETKEVRKYDLIRSGNAFHVNLDGLGSGKFDFTVREQNSNSVYNGRFEVLDFEIEKQFVNPDVKKLGQLAAQTGGAVFMPNQIDVLIDRLIQNDKYKPVQKAIVRKEPLTDSLYLLLFIVVCLTLEWFMRKYHGMS